MASNQQNVTQRNERYNNYVDAVTPQTGMLGSLWNSFWVGGLACLIAQGINEIYTAAFPKLSEDFITNITLMTLVSAAIILTGLGVYDIIGRKGGAGSFLPITGFANAMASASMEFKTEGLIMGTSVKLFSVVGPVLVNGVVWSSVIGVARYLIARV